MIYKNETLSEFMISRRNKKVVIYGDQLYYNIMKMEFSDLSNIIGEIYGVIKSPEISSKNNMSIINIPTYPDLESLLSNINYKDLIIVCPSIDNMRYFYNNYNLINVDIEVHYLPLLIGRPEPYDLQKSINKHICLDRIPKIPKIIHWIWFGDNLIPPLFHDCMASWKKYCPDYKIMFWNKKTYDITSNEFALYYYKKNEMGYVSDYIRLDVLYEYGGIYLDTDMELLKSLDIFLNTEMFFSIYNAGNVLSGLPYGTTAKNPEFQKIIYEHNDLKLGYEAFIKLTKPWKNELQYDSSRDMMIYPSDIFAPINNYFDFQNFTNNTYAIHHSGHSWTDFYPKDKNMNMVNHRRNNNELIKNIFGDSLYTRPIKGIYDRL